MPRKTPQEPPAAPVITPGPFPTDSDRLVAEAKRWLYNRPSVEVTVEQLVHECFSTTPQESKTVQIPGPRQAEKTTAS